MISWIQKYFQHHFKTVFAVLLAITIVSFIFTIGASPGLGRGERGVVERRFFDYDLSLPEDQGRLFGDARLSAMLLIGSTAGLDGEQIQNYAFQRGATLHLADEWHIPAGTSAEVADKIKGLRMFSGQDGAFDAKAYATFRDSLKTNPNTTEADVLRVLSDDIRAEKVNKILSGPGYVLPAEIKQQLSRSDTTWTLATASVDYAAYNPGVKPSDADLTKFFDENSFRYEIPPHVVADYVDFPSGAFVGQVAVTEPEVRAYYDANPARFPKPPEAKPADSKTPATPAKADPAADYAAVRLQVEAALKFERAQKLAQKAAANLTLALYNSKVARGAALDSFLAGQKLSLKPLKPFTREAGPAELGGNPEIATEAFKLNASRYYSEALSTPTGAAVLFWKETQASRKPLLTEVREKVLTDWTDSEKRKRFAELGHTLKAQLETRLKAGDTFEKAAEAVSASAGVKLTTKNVAAFTLRTPPQDLDSAIYGTLERLEKGRLSDMESDQSKGLFVYAVDKKLPEFTEANPRFTETRTQLAGGYARYGTGNYISDLVTEELKKSEPKPQ